MKQLIGIFLFLMFFKLDDKQFFTGPKNFDFMQKYTEKYYNSPFVAATQLLNGSPVNPSAQTHAAL